MEALLAAMKKYHALSGEIVDYFWRDEFQQRGTPHTHMAVYIKDAPIFGVHPDSSICEFADRYITTFGEGLTAENLEAQQHKHSTKYCLRKCDQGKPSYCRFGFPKLPMLETTIVRPLPADTATDDRNKYQAIYEKIRIAVQRIDDEQRLAKKHPMKDQEQQHSSFSDFLASLGLSWSHYLLGLRSIVQKAVILYKRDPDAIRRNPYNPRLLKLQNSNTDAQLVLDPYSAANYISSYMMKTNLSLSKLMKDAYNSVRETSGNRLLKSCVLWVMYY
jgi:hypothetical protein